MTLASAINSSIMRLPASGGATLSDLDDFDITQPQLTAGLRRALAVALTKLGLRALFQASDGGNDDTHRTARDYQAGRRASLSVADHIFSRL